MAHMSGSAAKMERAVGEKQAGPAESQRIGGETGREGAQGGETGVARRRARGTRRARLSSEERDQGGTRKKKKQKRKKVRQGTKEGQTEGLGPRGRRGKQGANKGAKVHIVSLRKTPCR